MGVVTGLAVTRDTVVVETYGGVVRETAGAIQDAGSRDGGGERVLCCLHRQ